MAPFISRSLIWLSNFAVILARISKQVVTCGKIASQFLFVLLACYYFYISSEMYRLVMNLNINFRFEGFCFHIPFPCYLLRTNILINLTNIRKGKNFEDSSRNSTFILHCFDHYSAELIVWSSYGGGSIWEVIFLYTCDISV